MSGRPRVVCAGGSVVDRKLLIAHPPIPGTSNPARGVTSFGGVARNVAENLARLGVPVGLVSRVGDDDAGRAVTAHLSDLGVDVRQVTVALSGETAQYVAMLDPKGQLVLGAAAMDVLDGLAPSDLDNAWPGAGETSTWVFADCNLPIDTLAHAVRRARTEGTRLAVDGVSNPKVGRLPRDLTGIEVLFCNRDEARALAGHHGWICPDGDIDLACLLHEEGAAQVVLTRGPDGVVLVDRNGPRILPATAASVYDVTGAGDALVAGTLAMLCAGADLDEAVTTGTLVAALTVESQHSVRPDLSADLVDAASVHRLRREGQLAAAHLTHRQLELPSSPDHDPLHDPLSGPVPPMLRDDALTLDPDAVVPEPLTLDDPVEAPADGTARTPVLDLPPLMAEVTRSGAARSLAPWVGERHPADSPEPEATDAGGEPEVVDAAEAVVEDAAAVVDEDAAAVVDEAASVVDGVAAEAHLVVEPAVPEPAGEPVTVEEPVAVDEPGSAGSPAAVEEPAEDRQDGSVRDAAPRNGRRRSPARAARPLPDDLPVDAPAADDAVPATTGQEAG